MVQPSIPGIAVGIPRMVYGNDGTNWIAVLVDALGHIQADILSTVLPTDAATETTLLLIKGYVDALETLLAGGLPAALDTGALKTKEQSPLTGFATSTNQTTMITALQLIDDLRNALGSVNTDDLQVDVKTSALPSGAATEATLAHAVEHLTLLSELVEALESINLDTLLVSSKSGDKIFGFESIVEEALSNTNLAAGSNQLNGTPVPAGKIWKITHAAIHYVGTVPTVIGIEATGLATALIVMKQISPVSQIWYPWDGDIYMQVGDYLTGYVDGATAGDDLYFRYAGLQMNAP